MLLTAASVAVAGPIGFVGFLAPHIIRVALRNRNEGEVPLATLVPLTTLAGATLTLSADLASRAMLFWSDAPAGIWVTLFGGIAFLFLAPPVAEDIVS